MITAVTQDHHQGSTLDQRERCQDVGLGMKGFLEGEKEDLTTTGLHSGQHLREGLYLEGCCT